MPKLEFASTEESTLTVSVALKKAYRWFKNKLTEHPVASAAILAGLITAAVFSGGALLAVPATLLIISKIGAIASLIGAAICSALAENDPHPSKPLEWALLGFLGLLGATLACFFPIVGVVLCGVLATGLSASASAGLSHLCTSRNQKMSTSETSEALSSEQAIGNSSLKELSKLPSVSNAADKLVAPSAEMTSTTKNNPKSALASGQAKIDYAKSTSTLSM